jgi:integrase
MPNSSALQSVRRSFATACKAAGITDFHIHDLRHTCAAWAVQAGAPLLEVCHLLRHSDIRMTMRYAHLAPEHVRAVVQRLENRDKYGVYDQATPGL